VPDIRNLDDAASELDRQLASFRAGLWAFESGISGQTSTDVASMAKQGALPQGTEIGPSAATFRLLQGVRVGLARIVGTDSREIAKLDALKKGRGSWDRAKISALVGPEKTNTIVKMLDNEQTFADTANTVERMIARAIEMRQESADFEKNMSLIEKGINYVLVVLIGAIRFIGGKITRRLRVPMNDNAQDEATREALARLLVCHQHDDLIEALGLGGGN
jgi:hypothetical protein